MGFNLGCDIWLISGSNICQRVQRLSAFLTFVNGVHLCQQVQPLQRVKIFPIFNHSQILKYLQVFQIFPNFPNIPEYSKYISFYTFGHQRNPGTIIGWAGV